MCCCFLPSCCCGWQTLEHGLFIFALLDILFNLFMVGMNVAAYSTVFAGLNVALFVADICLAVGAKQAVGFLSLFIYILGEPQKRSFLVARSLRGGGIRA